MTLSCLITFYNESDVLLSILSELKKISKITQFVLVDDGSTNGLTKKIERTFPSIKVVVMRTNKGKSAAVRRGMKHVTGDTVLLFDADLLQVQSREVARAIAQFVTHNYDQLIMENRGDNDYLDSILQKDLCLSGKRIMRSADLRTVLEEGIHRFELEVAINKYAIAHHHKIGWIKNTAYNPHKIKKMGLLKGIEKDIMMTRQIIDYIGTIGYLEQMLYFAKLKKTRLTFLSF
jgi:glycosyltransferase involved in cell wall biosynthesis